MHALLLLLGFLGFVAVLRHAGVALLRALGRTAEGVVAGQQHALHAQRGDLTGMAEAGEWKLRARRRRRTAWVVVGLWAALLVVPALASWTAMMYAAYAALWLLPAGGGRRRAS